MVVGVRACSKVAGRSASETGMASPQEAWAERAQDVDDGVVRLAWEAYLPHHSRSPQVLSGNPPVWAAVIGQRVLAGRQRWLLRAACVGDLTGLPDDRHPLGRPRR